LGERFAAGHGHECVGEWSTSGGVAIDDVLADAWDEGATPNICGLFRSRSMGASHPTNAARLPDPETHQVMVEALVEQRAPVGAGQRPEGMRRPPLEVGHAEPLHLVDAIDASRLAPWARRNRPNRTV
jgi:hypothetical protein